MRVFLETDRLTLRRFTEADENNLCELNSDPEVMRFLTGGKPTSRDDVRTEGSRALIGKGFTEFGVRRVVAETMTGNEGSRRVLEKSGLIQVDTFATAGQAAADSAGQGHVVYELTRADWESRKFPME